MQPAKFVCEELFPTRRLRQPGDRHDVLLPLEFGRTSCIFYFDFQELQQFQQLVSDHWASLLKYTKQVTLFPDITPRRFQRLTTPPRSSSLMQYYRRIYTTVSNIHVLQTLSREENAFSLRARYDRLLMQVAPLYTKAERRTTLPSMSIFSSGTHSISILYY